MYEAFLRFGIVEDIPVADWAPRGSRESVTNIVEQLERHPTVPAVLLGNHGLLAFSRDPLATAQLIIIMEESAQLTLDDQVFVAAFVRAHGSIKEMEQVFGVSYPTIKARLNRLAAMLDFIETAPSPPHAPSDEDVIDRLARGELSPEDAIRALEATQSEDPR